MEKYQDKILLCLALLVLGGAIAFNHWEKNHVVGSKGKASELAANAPYQTVAEKAPDLSGAKPAVWGDPMAQKDPGETFEVATNPWIYVDKLTGAVTFKAPQVKGVRTTPDFALELVGFRDDEFPLQLAGVSGDDQAVFYDVITGNTFTAASGYDGPNVAHIGGDKADNPANLDLHLVIRNVEVKRVPVVGLAADPGASDITEEAAFADVVDPATGKTYHLSSQTRLLQGKPFARLLEVAGAEKGTVISLREGGSVVIPPYLFHDPNTAVIPPDWETAPDTYTLSAVNVGPPPTVHITRTTPDLVHPELENPGPDTIEMDLDLVRETH